MLEPMWEQQDHQRRSPVKKSGRAKAEASAIDTWKEIIIEERYSLAVLAAGAVLVIAVYLVVWKHQLMPMNYLSYILVLLCGVGIAIELNKLKKMGARAGEMSDELRAIVRELNRLIDDGYLAVHDIHHDDLRIHSVLVGPAGVFAIEKYVRWNMNRNNPRFELKDEFIHSPGAAPSDTSIRNVKLAAEHVRDILLREAGVHIRVTPVLVYPEWMIDESSSPVMDFWLVSALGLREKLLDAERTGELLAEEDIRLIHSRLDEYQWRAKLALQDE